MIVLIKIGDEDTDSHSEQTTGRQQEESTRMERAKDKSL